MNQHDMEPMRWADGENPPSKSEPDALSETQQEAAREFEALGTFLRQHHEQPRLPNPDFFAHSVMETIRREEKPTSTAQSAGWWSRFSPLRMAWSGAALIAAGVALAFLLIPGAETQPRFPGPIQYRTERLEVQPQPFYMAEITQFRSHDPEVYVSVYRSSPDRVTVLWLDGLAYLPEAHVVQ